VNRTFGASLRAALGRPNPSLWWGLGVATTLLGLILVWPGAREFFGLAVLPVPTLMVSVGVGAALLASLQLIKLVYGRRLLA
jgi:Ca2+-transporting ATPase